MLLQIRILALIAALAPAAWVSAATMESPPAPSQPESPAPPSGEPSNQAPSPRDPGMVKEPEVTGPPGAVVTPPVVDPQIAVNPEERAQEGTSDSRKRDTRPPADIPQPRQQE
jgi:hypothetical protein